MKVSNGTNKKITRTTDGELASHCVGTGSAFAKTLNQNNLLVMKGDDHLLIDCGTKCCQALYDKGLPIGNIRNFLITHSHADHIGGLEEVMLFNRYVLQQKPSIVINQKYQKILWEQSLRGGSEMAESRGLAFKDLWNIIRPKKLKDYPRETWEADIGSINIKMPRTKHIPDDASSWRTSFWSCGVILDERVFFTSDTRFDPDLLESFDAMFDFDIIFHDCQMFTGGVHASIHELATLPAHIKSRIVLMHYGDNWRDFRQQAKEAGFHSWAKEGHTYKFPA
ncbi:MAG: MBL fold metallo-hydrolase [Pseudomonadales bacterium]|nr:MBL fold metallo-hydrolase [Pseudomonadales bacterium]